MVTGTLKVTIVGRAFLTPIHYQPLNRHIPGGNIIVVDGQYTEDCRVHGDENHVRKITVI